MFRNLKTFIALLTAAAFLTATLPAAAQETAARPAPHFISMGKPLTTSEITRLNQQMLTSCRVSIDAGGQDDDIPKADAIFMGIVVVGLLAGLIYLAVWQGQQASKL